jgi:hypothetical protein
MEINGQLQAQTALLPEKGPPLQMKIGDSEWSRAGQTRWSSVRPVILL